MAHRSRAIAHAPLGIADQRRELAPLPGQRSHAVLKVGRDLISRVTDAVIEDVRAWQQRPLEDVYPVVFLDCLGVEATALAALHRYGIDQTTLVANQIEALVAIGEWDDADTVSAAALRTMTANSPHQPLIFRTSLEVGRGAFDAGGFEPHEAHDDRRYRPTRPGSPNASFGAARAGVAARTARSVDFTPRSWRTSLRCASGRQTRRS